MPGAAEVFARSGSSVARMGVAAHTIGLMEAFSRVPGLGIGAAATSLAASAPGKTSGAGFRRRHRRAPARKGALT